MPLAVHGVFVGFGQIDLVRAPTETNVPPRDLDPVRGHEQAGVRPVLVVSSYLHLRLTRSTALTVLPLTTKPRPHLLHRVKLDVPRQQTSYVITEQLRSISADRLTSRRPIFTLTQDQITEVRDVLRRMIDA